MMGFRRRRHMPLVHSWCTGLLVTTIISRTWAAQPFKKYDKEEKEQQQQGRGLFSAFFGSPKKENPPKYEITKPKYTFFDTKKPPLPPPPPAFAVTPPAPPQSLLSKLTNKGWPSRTKYPHRDSEKKANPSPTYAPAIIGNLESKFQLVNQKAESPSTDFNIDVSAYLELAGLTPIQSNVKLASEVDLNGLTPITSNVKLASEADLNGLTPITSNVKLASEADLNAKVNKDDLSNSQVGTNANVELELAHDTKKIEEAKAEVIHMVQVDSGYKLTETSKAESFQASKNPVEDVQNQIILKLEGPGHREQPAGTAGTGMGMKKVAEGMYGLESKAKLDFEAKEAKKVEAEVQAKTKVQVISSSRAKLVAPGDQLTTQDLIHAAKQRTFDKKVSSTFQMSANGKLNLKQTELAIGNKWHNWCCGGSSCEAFTECHSIDFYPLCCNNKCKCVKSVEFEEFEDYWKTLKRETACRVLGCNNSEKPTCYDVAATEFNCWTQYKPERGSIGDDHFGASVEHEGHIGNTHEEKFVDGASNAPQKLIGEGYYGDNTQNSNGVRGSETQRQNPDHNQGKQKLIGGGYYQDTKREKSVNTERKQAEGQQEAPSSMKLLGEGYYQAKNNAEESGQDQQNKLDEDKKKDNDKQPQASSSSKQRKVGGGYIYDKGTWRKIAKTNEIPKPTGVGETKKDKSKLGGITAQRHSHRFQNLEGRKEKMFSESDETDSDYEKEDNDKPKHEGKEQKQETRKETKKSDGSTGKQNPVPGKGTKEETKKGDSGAGKKDPVPGKGTNKETKKGDSGSGKKDPVPGKGTNEKTKKGDNGAGKRDPASEKGTKKSSTDSTSSSDTVYVKRGEGAHQTKHDSSVSAGKDKQTPKKGQLSKQLYIHVERLLREGRIKHKLVAEGKDKDRKKEKPTQKSDGNNDANKVDANTKDGKDVSNPKKQSNDDEAQQFVVDLYELVEVFMNKSTDDKSERSDDSKASKTKNSHTGSSHPSKEVGKTNEPNTVGQERIPNEKFDLTKLKTEVEILTKKYKERDNKEVLLGNEVRKKEKSKDRAEEKITKSRERASKELATEIKRLLKKYEKSQAKLLEPDDEFNDELSWETWEGNEVEKKRRKETNAANEGGKGKQSQNPKEGNGLGKPKQPEGSKNVDNRSKSNDKRTEGDNAGVRAEKRNQKQSDGAYDNQGSGTETLIHGNQREPNDGNGLQIESRKDATEWEVETVQFAYFGCRA